MSHHLELVLFCHCDSPQDILIVSQMGHRMATCRDAWGELTEMIPVKAVTQNNKLGQVTTELVRNEGFGGCSQSQHLLLTPK